MRFCLTSVCFLITFITLAITWPIDNAFHDLFLYFLFFCNPVTVSMYTLMPQDLTIYLTCWKQFNFLSSFLNKEILCILFINTCMDQCQTKYCHFTFFLYKFISVSADVFTTFYLLFCTFFSFLMYFYRFILLLCVMRVTVINNKSLLINYTSACHVC